MPRRQKIRPELVSILSSRIALSKGVRVLKLKDIRTAWELSPSTIYRYDNPAYRELSRETTRRMYKKNGRFTSLADICPSCLLSLTGHARCKQCEILLHENSLFGKSPDGENCESCIDSLDRKKIREGTAENAEPEDYYEQALSQLAGQ